MGYNPDFTKLKLLIKPKLCSYYHYPAKPIVIPPKYYIPPDDKNFLNFSIVTPSHNSSKFITKTIECIVDQRYPNVEYIIQDNLSKDGTIDILKNINCDYLQWESIEDTGQANAINLGFEKSSGEIMAYLNADDILLPGSLHYVSHFFNKHPNVDVIYSHRVIIDEFDQEIGRWILPRHSDKILLLQDYVPQETLFWRRHIWDRAGGKMDESFHFAMDWELLLRFLMVGARFTRVPRFLGAFRIHSDQKTMSHMHNTGNMEINRLRKHYHNKHISHRQAYFKTKFYLIKHLILRKLYRLGIVKY